MPSVGQKIGGSPTPLRLPLPLPSRDRLSITGELHPMQLGAHQADRSRAVLTQPSSDMYPRFFMDEVLNALASEREGRPIYLEEERVELNYPGNPYTKPVMRVTDEHRQRWPEEYEAFKSGQEVAVHGTPLEQWPVLKRSMVLELKALGFHTVEQIRDMNDHAVQRVPMYGRKMKELAAAYLDDAVAAAALSKAQVDIDRRDAQIAALRLQVENLTSQMAEMFGQLQDRLNAPDPIAAVIPATLDPTEIEKLHATQAERQSAFADLPDIQPRKRRTAAKAEADVE
jgi:hypothetical protein